MSPRWLIPAAVLLAACGSVPAANATSSYVPWLALAPQHQYVDAPPATPVPPIPVPAGTPACQASQLEGVSLGMNGAAGNVNMPLLFRNRGSSACYLEGYPDATVLSPAGTVLASGSGATGRGTYFNDGPVVQVLLRPGEPALPAPGPGYSPPMGEAFMNFSWYDCQPLQGNRLALDLPNGGGRLVMPFDTHAYYSAACDASKATTPAVFRGPFSPTGVDWPPGADYTKVEITIKSPQTVHRGTTLKYLVTVADEDSRDYTLAPCPDYSELLGAKVVVATYLLNCGPVGTIRSGEHVTFQMQMNVPASMAQGPTRVTWVLQDGRISPINADATIDVT